MGLSGEKRQEELKCNDVDISLGLLRMSAMRQQVRTSEESARMRRRRVRAGGRAGGGGGGKASRLLNKSIPAISSLTFDVQTNSFIFSQPQRNTAMPPHLTFDGGDGSGRYRVLQQEERRAIRHFDDGISSIESSLEFTEVVQEERFCLGIISIRTRHDSPAC